MCERSVKVSPGYASGYNNLGLVLQALKETDGAISAFRSAISLEPRTPPAYLNLARLYLKLGMPPKAGKVLREYLELEPGNPEVRKLLRSLDD